MPHTTTEDEAHTPIPASVRDQQSPVWDMSQERVVVEQLVNQRFNFFLLFFSLVIAGTVNARQQWHLYVVLTVGTAICLLLARVLRRTQEKFELVLLDLYSDPSHPATIINRRAKPKGSVRRIIGIWIPLICCGALIFGVLASLFGLILVK